MALDISAVDVASVVGLTAMVLLYGEHPARAAVPLFRIHNWTGYVALAVAVLHPTILLWVKTPHFRIAGLLLPLASPGQRTYNMLGALTSCFRPERGYRRW